MTPIKFIAISIFSFLTFTRAYGQVKQDKNFLLNQIKNLHRQINDYKNYKTIIINDAEEFLGQGTDNGGSLTGYLRNDSLQKIIEWIGLSTKVIQNEYYLDNGKLVFVYSTESRYVFNASSQSFDYSKLNNVYKGSYYFNNNKLIETIISDKKYNDTKQKDAANFLISSKKYLKLLNAKTM